MTRIDEKFLRVTMPDGSRWDVPISLIAIHRAKYYAKHDGITYEESYENDTIPLFRDNEYDVHDYAANNMNWDDVKKWARKVKEEKDVDFQEGWMNGEYEIVEGDKK